MSTRTKRVLLAWAWIVVGIALGMVMAHFLPRDRNEDRHAQDFAYGDGIHQGCEWCGSRCDAYLRGWHQGEKEAR